MLRGEIAAGRKLRLLYLPGPQMREYEGETLGEEMEFAARQDWLSTADGADEAGGTS